MCAYAYATVLERGAAASIDIDAAVAAHHDEFAFRGPNLRIVL